MESSKRMMCAMVIMVVLLVASAEASCTVKNSSGKDIAIIPVSAPSKIIYVKVGAVVKVPTIYLNVIIKNLATGHTSGATKLADGTVVVCVDGVVKGTVSIYLGGLINGVLSILTGSIIVLDL